MLTARGAAARWAAAVAACAVAVLPALAATPAGADVVRDQELWVLDMVHAPQAWNVTRGQGVTVAVIDSGVFPSVSDLAGSVISGSVPGNCAAISGGICAGAIWVADGFRCSTQAYAPR